MEKVDLTVSLEAERLDALKFFMATKENTDPQTELQKALTQMYETYVPADTRAYLDSKLKPAATPKPRARRAVVRRSVQTFEKRNPGRTSGRRRRPDVQPAPRT